MTDNLSPRRENLVRAMAPGTEMRVSDETGKPRLSGHFARFDTWNLIDSAIEGRFLERIAPGAFTKTFAERTPKIQFNHGKDPAIGEKVIASRGVFGEDEIGPTVDGEVLDGLDPLLVAGLRAGEYGMSYRFSIPTGKDIWVRNAKPSSYNPDGLPERTIREAMVFEVGPVTWPADGGTDVAVRSLTDLYTLDLLTADPERLAALIDAKQGKALDAPEPVTATPVERAATPVATQSSPTVSERETTVDYISREDKASRVKELESAIAARAEEFTGVFPEDVQARDDADVAEREQLLRDIAAVEARAARVASFANDEKRTEATYIAPTVVRTKSVEDIYDIRAVDRASSTPEDRAQKLRDNAMRSIESSALPTNANVDALSRFIDREMADEDEDGRLHQEATRRILLTGSPAYKRAFAKYLKNGNQFAWTPEEARSAALAVTGTTTTGGYAVPYIFDPTFIRIGAYTSVNPYRAACRVETISGGNNWRAVTATAITAKWDTEAAASVEGGPTIGQPSYTVQRADAFATVSIETLQDRPDVTEELSLLFGEAKDTLEENSFTLGAGSTVYPQGMFLSGAFTVKATATNDVTAILDTIAVEGDLPIRHRAKAAWFMSRSTQRQLELLDTTGYYFKRPGQFFAMGKAEIGQSPTGNTGTQLLGYPIWEVPSAVSTLTTDAAVIAVFANPSQYVIVDRIGMNVEVVPTMLNGATPSFPTGQRGIYCYWRSTARVLNVDGGRQMKVQ